MGTRILIIVLFVLSVLTSSALTYLIVTKTNAVNANGVGPAVSQFIEKNPEVIIQALRNAQQARAEKEEADADKAAVQLRPQLENGNGDAVTGNKDGDVTMVVFHDHNCGFCRKSVPDIEKLLSEDKNLKFVIKDFPILGPLSVEKAKASLAVTKLAPEKGFEYYDLLAHNNTQTIDQVIDLVKDKLGIDPARLRSEMESKEIESKIAENHALGEQLGVSGTPVFVINGKVLRGALGYDAFKAAIDEARANKKS